MKTPRDLSGIELCGKLSIFGYTITRRSGSHIRLTTNKYGEHHLTIPAHDPLKMGTLNSILSSVSSHMKLSKEELLKILFG